MERVLQKQACLHFVLPKTLRNLVTTFRKFKYKCSFISYYLIFACDVVAFLLISQYRGANT
jgi:hypothetical protein